MKIVSLEPAEPDSTGTKKIERICKLLESNGHEVLRQAADNSMFASILKYAPDVVFNLASIYGWERTNLIPAILEIAGVQYTGSNLLSLSLARNYTKRFPLLMASEVPMAAFEIIKAGNTTVPAGFHFPLTLYCDGIYDEMTIKSQTELVKELINYPPREDLVLQKVVSGEKSSIYILDSVPFLPPENPDYLEPSIKAYQLLEARGLARFDFVENGNFYLDEIDLSPDPLDDAFLQAAAEYGLDEAGIMQQLLEHAGRDLPVPGRRGSYLLKRK
jgi:D-alanine-D-alanine ligase-like ATP-grasp enzyme